MRFPCDRVALNALTPDQNIAVGPFQPAFGGFDRRVIGFGSIVAGKRKRKCHNMKRPGICLAGERAECRFEAGSDLIADRVIDIICDWTAHNNEGRAGGLADGGGAEFSVDGAPDAPACKNNREPKHSRDDELSNHLDCYMLGKLFDVDPELMLDPFGG